MSESSYAMRAMSRIGCYLVGISLLLAGCAGISPPREPQDGRVNHLVLCWLKQPGDVAQRQQIIEQTLAFRTIPGVQEVRVGEVLSSERGIVDDSFDVGILMSFASREDMQAYLEHPLHRAALRDLLQPLVSRVLVYDFVEP